MMTVWAADEITARDERPLIVSFPFQKPMSLRKASTSKITCRMEMICKPPRARTASQMQWRHGRRSEGTAQSQVFGRHSRACARHLPACNEGGHQWPSEVIRGHQRGVRMALTCITTNRYRRSSDKSSRISSSSVPRPRLAPDEGGNQWSSEVIRGHQRSSEGH